MLSQTPLPPMSIFQPIQKTGVIYVMAEAHKAGYREDDTAWVNLGQGQPETSTLGTCPRLTEIVVNDRNAEYAPVAGLWELREEIAGFYNREYRRGLPRPFSADHVCVAPGGRAALTRAAATIGRVNLGHLIPDYTAYEELLNIFRSFIPIPVLLEPEKGYGFAAADLEKEILGRGLGALLLSNPCNPTGKCVAGEELERWLAVARKSVCALIFDEFYSMYWWTGDAANHDSLSAARYIEDIDKENVVLINGLTKGWRYPGLRIAWAIGPQAVCEAMASAGSFLDGGATRPLQKAALPLFAAERYAQERASIQNAFRPKRQYLIAELKKLGVRFDNDQEGTFYAWGDISAFPKTINDGMSFFSEALRHKLIVVPGEFFDIDPGQRRESRQSRFRHYVRFSFGAPLARLQAGIASLKQLLAAVSA